MAQPEVHADELRADRPLGLHASARRVLPLVAAVGMAISLAGLLTTTAERKRVRVGSDETKASAESALEGLVAMYPPAADDRAFLAAVDRARHAPHVAGAWCFRADGRLVWAQGSTAMSTPVGRTADELATGEARRLLETMGAEWQDPEKRLALLAASAIASEGEHNDIYRHALRTLHDREGRLTGFVGLVYHASPSVGTPSAIYLTGLALLLAGLAVYWIAIPIWVLLDARPRAERAFVWATFAAMGNLVALAAYLLTRGPHLPTSASDTSRA